MKKHRKSSSKTGQRSAKEAYEPPKLIRYGKLKDLTAELGGEGFDSAAQQQTGS